MTPNTESEFTFHFLTHIVTDEPESDTNSEIDPFQEASDEIINEVCDRVFPLIVKTGFYEKTDFSLLSIFCVLVDSTEAASKVSYTVQKKDKTLTIDKTFHEAELNKGLQTNPKKFITNTIGELVLGLCQKYELDPTPMSLLDESKTKRQPVAATREVVDESEELIVHIKLINDDFGAVDDFVKNTQIMESIDYCLQQSGVGVVDASEIGSGYETIFCVGPNALFMQEKLQKHFEKLPAGSYLEIFHDGETRKILL